LLPGQAPHFLITSPAGFAPFAQPYKPLGKYFLSWMLARLIYGFKSKSMKKNIPLCMFCIVYGILLLGCNMTTPEKYFDVAVLNSNMLTGFANDGQWRELASPPGKATDDKGGYIAMQRGEALQAKITFVEENTEKLKGLQQTADTKEILEYSITLHEFVLRVYKNEYMQLANLYDAGAPEEKITALAKTINQQYFNRFDELYNKLINSGKSYAVKHNIKVNWAM
jgi:hypothetical protein